MFPIDITATKCDNNYADKIAEYLSKRGIPTKDSLYIITSSAQNSIGIYIGESAKKSIAKGKLNKYLIEAYELSRYDEVSKACLSFLKNISNVMTLAGWTVDSLYNEYFGQSNSMNYYVGNTDKVLSPKEVTQLETACAKFNGKSAFKAFIFIVDKLS